MKKIFGVSFVAMLAIAPMMAMADPATGTEQVPAVTTSAVPEYQGKAANENIDNSLATAGYVKGAYNDAIKAVNKVYSTLDTAKADKSAIGQLSGTYSSVLNQETVYGNIEALAGAINTLDGGAIKEVQVNGTALTATNGAVNVTVAEGSTDGTIAVNGADVDVHGLGSAAFTDSGAYATSTQGAKADQAALDIGTMGSLTTTETGSLVGAINELDSAIDGINTDLDDYAKKTGVEQTIKNTKVLLAVANNWAGDSGTTIDLDVKAASVTYAEPQAGNNQQNGGNQQSGGTEQSGGNEEP